MFRILSLGLMLLAAHSALGGDQPLRVGVFHVDATPPLGSALCDGLVPPAKEIVDPLSARGVVLLTDERPIVLCVLDWVGIGNEGHDAFRLALAEAAGTTPERVSVHAVHQHDAPGCDFGAEKILAAEGMSGACFDPEFARKCIVRTAAAVKAAVRQAVPVSHIGLGEAIVEKVASNRRILGEDGKVAVGRMSSSKIEKAIAAPEGVIDPKLRLISFWQQERPLASLTYYATHPQSHYGKGGVSADFPGLARKLREGELPELTHIHFNGAGGNVAAGKYNDGSPAMRAILAERLAKGMKAAWEGQTKTPITATQVRWTYCPVLLPLRDTLAEEKAVERIRDPKLLPRERVRAARDLAYLRRIKAGQQININCLRLGPAWVMFMPGELFIEYQLAAQQMRPKDFVAMAAYGDYGPGYIGTQISYSQGGYETSFVSRTAPEVEAVLLGALRELLVKR